MRILREREVAPGIIEVYESAESGLSPLARFNEERAIALDAYNQGWITAESYAERIEEIDFRQHRYERRIYYIWTAVVFVATILLAIVL